MVASWPKWAQRHVVLGLDLQGGSHILLEVDTKAVRKEMLETVRDDVRRVLRDARIGYTGLVVRGNSVEVRIREGQNSALWRRRNCKRCRSRSAAFIAATGNRNVNISSEPGDLYRLTVSDPAIVERVRQAVEQSIQIIERQRERTRHRRAAHPCAKALIAFWCRCPGLQDPTRLKELLGKTAKLDFRMVDVTTSPEQALQGRVPPDDEILYGAGAQDNTPYVLEKRILVSGAELTDAQPASINAPASRSCRSASTRRARASSRRPRRRTSGKPFADRARQSGDLGAWSSASRSSAALGQISGSFTGAEAPTILPSCCAPARCRRRSPSSRSAPSAPASAPTRSPRARSRLMSAPPWWSSSCSRLTACSACSPTCA